MDNHGHDNAVKHNNTGIEKYIRCRYCSELYNYNNEHKCSNNYKDKLIYCYSCGEKDKEYSNTQLLKEGDARCKTCVLNQIRTRYAPYLHMSEGAKLLDLMHINNKLIYYINNLDLQKVNELLKDINIDLEYIRQDYFFDTKEYRWTCWYNKDGTEKPDNDPISPNTPLKLCIFRLSDSLLSKDKKYIIIEITKSLIDAGAIVDDNVIDFFTHRYGTRELINDDNIFDKFYHLLIQNKKNYATIIAFKADPHM